jgi:hypothetical protein
MDLWIFLLKFREYLKHCLDCFSFEYARTSRTLCPDNNYYSPHNRSIENVNDVIVSVSTASPYSLNFSLLVSQETNFSIR